MKPKMYTQYAKHGWTFKKSIFGLLRKPKNPIFGVTLHRNS